MEQLIGNNLELTEDVGSFQVIKQNGRGYNTGGECRQLDKVDLLNCASSMLKECTHICCLKDILELM